MRPVLLVLALLALVAATCSLWSIRFLGTPGVPRWTLADLHAGIPAMAGLEWLGTPGNPRLRITRHPGEVPVAVRIPLPGFPAVEGLHVSYRIAATSLVPGNEEWEDGRFIVEWQDPQGSAAEKDPAGTIRLDQVGVERGIVVRPLASPSVPALRFEHLGRSGSYEISELEVTAVEERWVWKTGRWLLAAAWMAWCFFGILRWPFIGRNRAALAGLAWVILMIHFAVPGPWKTQRPLYPAFQIGNPEAPRSAGPEGVIPAAHPAPGLDGGAVEPTGNIPVQGSIPLRIKYLVVRARPLLHVLMLAAPALLFALLLGARPSLFPSLTLAFGIELAQLGFGYGFGWDDVLDLTYDATGIALGIWACAWARRAWSKRYGGGALSPRAQVKAWRKLDAKDSR